MKIDATLRHGYVALTENGNTRALLSPDEAQELAISLVLRAGEAANRALLEDPHQGHLALSGGSSIRHKHWCQHVTQGKRCNCERVPS